jgi:hypothetical protein
MFGKDRERNRLPERFKISFRGDRPEFEQGSQTTTWDVPHLGTLRGRYYAQGQPRELLGNVYSQ